MAHLKKEAVNGPCLHKKNFETRTQVSPTNFEMPPSVFLLFLLTSQKPNFSTTRLSLPRFDRALFQIWQLNKIPSHRDRRFVDSALSL